MLRFGGRDDRTQVAYKAAAKRQDRFLLSHDNRSDQCRPGEYHNKCFHYVDLFQNFLHFIASASLIISSSPNR